MKNSLRASVSRPAAKLPVPKSPLNKRDKNNNGKGEPLVVQTIVCQGGKSTRTTSKGDNSKSSRSPSTPNTNPERVEYWVSDPFNPLFRRS